MAAEATNTYKIYRRAVVPNFENILHDNNLLKFNDMKNLKFKKSRFIPNLTDKENKKLFRAMNIALIFGGLSLILTFLYLIGNLDKADKILINCMPGFVFGMVLMVLYTLGQNKLNKIKKQTRFEKSISFGQ